ncbi:MAG: hypothetical protein CVU16_11260, partial [Betaproteobacteria bacterium HGW-Betaproteobacteria-10]
MNGTNCSRFKKRAAALAVASFLSLAPWVAEAAGIGKLTVLSALGQPLRAELVVSANREEIAGMAARLAPQDAFRQAGVEYAPVLLDLRFALDKRANGQSVVKVTSVRPVNEPFLDFLVELNWPTGRLVREYTFLLDPPDIAVAQSARPVVEARVVETLRGDSASPERSLRSTLPRQASQGAAVDAKRVASAGRLVLPGDTLRKIAGENQYAGVSLEQMLVGLFRENPDAFIGQNINRLKAGAILGLPDKLAVEAVSDAEAKHIYVTQTRDWNAYRQRLAASAAKAAGRDGESTQASAGKIVAKVEEKVAPVEKSQDKVVVSSSETAVNASLAGKAAITEADRLAREKSFKEAQDRLALLEKNVSELQKLVEMKNQKLAELQQQNAVKQEARPVEPVKPEEPAKLAEDPKPVESVKAPEEPKPVVAEKPVQPKPVAPPKKPLAVPEPTPEPSFLDTLLEDPLPLAGGGGILALLAAYFLIKRRRNEQASMETTAAPGPSSLGPNSVFRMTGGQSIDTGNTPPQTGDFSQTGPGTIDTDEVDPVAEADVYMAYGRDAQAEEILLEALQKDPQRTAIHAKLLEIYAGRGSLKQFETLASELYAQTGGVGAEWEKVAALGLQLDPGNPLYSGARAALPGFDADATMIVSPESLAKATLIMPGELAALVEPAAPPDIPGEPADVGAEAADFSMPTDLKFSLDDVAEPIVQDNADESLSLDFDLGSPAPEEAPVEVEPEPFIESFESADVSDALDFDLANELPALPAVAQAEAQAVEPAVDEIPPAVADDFAIDGLDFDLNIPEAITQAEPDDVTPDFSPEGTLVMPSAMDEAVSTYIGIDEAPDLPQVTPSPAEELPQVADLALDLDLDLSPEVMQTVPGVATDPGLTETLVQSNLPLSESAEFDHPGLAETFVNAGVLDDDSVEFDVKLTDSVFLGQPMSPPDFDISSINLDLSADSTDLPVVEQRVAEPVIAEPVEPVVPTVDAVDA